MKYNYDVVVIGAGSGGLTAASGFQKIGKKVLLVEKEHMGGECTNSGCVPSKALLHHAKAFHQAHTIAGNSKKATTYRDEAFTYVRSIIDDVLAHETPEVFRGRDIDVVLGEAEFVAPNTVRAADAEYEFKHAVIATGSSPRRLDIPGVEEKDILTNQNLFALDNIPKRLLIIGGGPIGMEMGQALAMLGSQVTICDINDRFARLEDPAISPLAQKAFTDLGITIHLNASVTEVKNRIATINIKDGSETGKNIQTAYDKVLFAVGRVPNLPKGLTVAGIESTPHGITIDSQYRTSNKSVYAVGDVCQRLKFTHTADDVARQIVTRVASHGLLRVKNNKAVPKVTYTEPEIAQVGLSYEAALKKYPAREVMRIEVPFSENDRAVTDSITAGLLVVYVHHLYGAVLGANIIGPQAGELIAPFVLAIDHKISMWSLRRSIYAYPTYSLVIKKAGDKFFATQLGNLKADLLYTFKKHLPKFVVGLLWATLLWQLYAYKAAHGMDTTATALMIFDFITMTVWGPVLYVLVYTIRPLTFFPATALTILAGIFFGLWGGIALTLIGATLASAVAYGTGRFFGKGLALEDSVIGNWVMKLQANTFSAILTMRLIFLPFDGVSYFAGILKAAFFPFLIATFLGIILGSATFVSIGASLDTDTFRQNGFTTDIIDTKFLLLSAGIFAASLLLSKFLKRWQVEK